jgi:predicted GIY-YIG superfamily endonuclease
MKIKRNTKAIYLIENMENGRIKIGVSDNPSKRIKSLMSQGGCLMTLRYESHQITNFSKIESDLHSMFVESRFVGEWFNIDLKEAKNAVKRLVKNRHDCLIIRHFEEGKPIGEIAKFNNVSRTAIVNYLLSKGFRPKDRNGKTAKKIVYKPAEPYNVESSISNDKIAKMVELNNKKIAEKRSKINKLKNEKPA